MKKKEAKFQTKFGKWASRTYKHQNNSYGFELKQTETDKLYYSKVKEHQEDGLVLDKDIGRHYKYPDVGYTRYPYDSAFHKIKEGYIVIFFFSERRGNKQFVMIPIDNWMEEKYDSDKPYITFQRACEIGKLKNLDIYEK